ncbi:hypothetical protein Cgig2_021934 [Carnegiea gigantea]|uniref:Uncharacterized protein n=1 Tax=Carnegiea gigantea TaxID=171969 RepID=A0A9Q1GP42_9CARY|nr:hypothetical protein Cgig2_021934 [Carnegiea gigantea]
MNKDIPAKHQCIHCLRRNSVNTLGNGSRVKKITNSTRLGNKPSMPRSDKPTFLQPGMLARGREDEDLDLHNPRYTNVHSRELEEHTDETHTAQIGKEMNINANETETLQTGKERHSNESYREHVLLHMYDLWTNWRSDLKRYNITKLKRTLR